MSSRAAQVAVHFEGNKLSAVHARSSGSGLEVAGWLVATPPSGVNPADAAQFGAWMAGELDSAGMLTAAKKSGLLFAAARGEVVLKRIAVPPGATDQEIPNLVRLQMLRQVTVTGEAAGIDYVPLADGNAQAGAAVLAAAMPPERLQWRRDVAAAAKLKLQRVGLAAEGSARLLAERTQRKSGATLCVVLSAGNTELVVVESGRLVFARGIDIARPDPGESFDAVASALVVEARRTWMSYRVAPESAEIEGVLVLGTDEFATAVAQNLHSALQMPAETSDYPAGVTVPAAMSAAQRSAVAPLVGLLAQDDAAGLNFVSPRKAVAVNERRRRQALIGVLAAILVCGTVYTLASRDLGGRQSDLDSLKQQWATARTKHDAYMREKARVEHLERWLANRADFVAHLNLVTRQLPDTTEAILDELKGTLIAGLDFEIPKDGGKTYASGRWRPATRVTIELAGPSKSRAISDPLRERLKSGVVYEVSSPTADVPYRFDYVLTSAQGIPLPSDTPVSESKPAAPAKEGSK